VGNEAAAILPLPSGGVAKRAQVVGRWDLFCIGPKKIKRDTLMPPECVCV